MRARSFPLAWTLALMLLLLPVAAWMGECGDCFAADLPGCCPTVCSLCLCCGHGSTVLAGEPGMQLDPGAAPLVAGRTECGPLSADPRDVFHVPKPS